MLKGALHCHTTRSDGHVSPEEVMKMHKENGYARTTIVDKTGKYAWTNPIFLD